jgi:hypothetical protein
MAMSFDKEGFKSLSIEDQLKTITEYLDIFIAGAGEDDMKSLTAKMMQKIMGNGISMMKDMKKIVGSSVSAMNDILKTGGPLDVNDLFSTNGTFDMNGVFNIFGGHMLRQNGSRSATPEIRTLFEEWVRQIQEEIETYRKEHKDASGKDIAEYLKISEESLKYFIKDPVGEVPSKTESGPPV